MGGRAPPRLRSCVHNKKPPDRAIGLAVAVSLNVSRRQATSATRLGGRPAAAKCKCLNDVLNMGENIAGKGGFVNCETEGARFGHDSRSLQKDEWLCMHIDLRITQSKSVVPP